MNKFNAIAKTLLGRVVIAVLACSLAASCAKEELTDLQGQINNIVDRLDKLEGEMNAQLKALNDMLAGELRIKEVKLDEESGNTVVTLTDGQKLNLLPKSVIKSGITYLTLNNGEMYWAYFDETGKKNLLLDSKGEYIPVISEIPEVTVKDGKTYIIAGGEEYPFIGTSVFSDYTLAKNELTQEVYAVTFTFGDGMNFTITVDGAGGLLLGKPSEGSFVQVSGLFVPGGRSDKLYFQAREVLDYMYQKPDGWTVSEDEDENGPYFLITAPSEEQVRNGAPAECDFKVMSVLNGGKASMAKIRLSTKAFINMSFSRGKIDVERYSGYDKFIYGIVDKALYDENTALAEAKNLVTATEFQPGYGASTEDIKGMPIAELAGRELAAGDEYAFWAVPVMNIDGTDTVLEGTVEYIDVVYMLGVSEASYNDAVMKLQLEDAAGYYFGLTEKAGFSLDDVVANLNVSGSYTLKTEPLVYSGSVFGFAGMESELETEYVAWVAVTKEGQYTAEDVIICEFETLGLVPGSSVEVVVDKAAVKAAATEIKAPVSASGAEFIYCTYIPASELADYATEEAKVEYIFANQMLFEGESGIAKASEALAPVPETGYVLMALASDFEGKYGPVTVSEISTTAIAYNSLSVQLAVEKNDLHDIVVSVASEGATEYLYWVGKTSDSFWKSHTYLGGTALRAEEYMYANSHASDFTSVMTKYPVEGGKLKMTDLDVSIPGDDDGTVEYAVVVMAMDEDGYYSHASAIFFEPCPVHVGEMVPSTAPEWAKAKPNIVFNPNAFMPSSNFLMGQYKFDITIPANYTAYVMCGTEAYFTDGDTEEVISSRDKLIHVVYNANTPGALELLTDIEEYTEKGFPYGHEFSYWKHGRPRFGGCVIWPSREHHDAECDCMDTEYNVKDYWGTSYNQ